MALSAYEVCVTLCFEDGDLDDLDHDDQFSKTLEIAEYHCEVDIIPATELQSAFDKVRIQLGCQTPPDAKHSRVLHDSEDSESQSEVSDLELSSSEEEEQEVVREPDNIVDDVVVTLRVPQNTEGRLRYKPETLVSMIPDTPEYDRLKRSIGVLRTSSRFLPGMSNRRGRAILHSKGYDLKTYPRIEHREVLPYPLRSSVPFGGKPIRVMGLVRDSVVVRTTPTGAYASATRFLKREEKKVARLKYDPVKDVFRRIAIVDKHTVNVLGGKTYPRKRWITGRIDPEHKKYWYFLRKNGRVYRSEHHPYEDEE